MTKQISITIEEEQLKYLDELADLNGRSRSSMLNWLLKMAEASDAARLEEDN
jgi:metal-responsive CopG/Arc/MetJ family transcriptional regulator